MSTDADMTSYDNLDVDDYLAHIERPLSWNNLYERPAFKERLPELKGKNVLDAGCASGFMTEYALNQGAMVTAVDISKKLLERLTAHLNSTKLKIHCADLSQPMPFLKANTFDCVMISLVLHYIKDQTSIFNELYRVTKKGGRVVISTHHPFAIYEYFKPKSYFDFKMVEDEWGKKGGRSFKVHYYIRPLHEVLRPIINSGFKIISIDEPLPSQKCKELDQRTYERLMERPGFLFFVLEK